METEPDALDAPELAIHRAARLGDLVALERLLADGADINERGGFEREYLSYCGNLTPLMVAARSVDGASVDTLRWLLDHGAELDPKAAWYAAGRGDRWEYLPWVPPQDQTERLRFLLDAGLDPNEQDHRGRPVLLVEACAGGNPGNVRLLLELGVAPDTTMLFEAADSGSAKCVALLLDQGLDPNAKNVGEYRDGASLLSYAGSAEVVRVLLARGARYEGKDRFDRHTVSALLRRAMDGEVCFPGRAAAAQALFEAGYVPGRVCVNKAAFDYQADAVDWLLARKAPLWEGALFGVCWHSEGGSAALNDDELAPVICEQIIRSLVAAGISPDARDEAGNTPLHYAVGCDGVNSTAVRVLLELGASAELANNAGQTPLHIAASQVGLGGNACITALLDAGANPLLPDREGRTPLEIARRHAGYWEQSTTAERLAEARTGVALLLRSSPSNS